MTKYIIINQDKEVDYDYIHFHGPPETDLLSTYKDGFGDYYRTMWKIISKKDDTIIVKEF